MTPRRATASLSLLALASLPLGGCVNQDAYDDLRRSNDALKAQNQELLERNAQLEAAAREMAARFGTADMTREQMAQLIKDLEAQLASKNQMLSDFDQRFGQIKVGTLLDPQTDAALRDLAARYPNLLSYDAERGMVRFNSDITFASGSWDLTSSARSAIGEFAKLLREIPSAGQYDIKVIGHTDSQRVSQRPGRRFTNNDELSAFRSIAVANEFANNGLPRQKLEFAGFGEHRPIIDRGPNANVPENRRVEVYLVKSTWSGATTTSAPASAPATAPQQPAQPRTMDIMK